MQSAMLPIMADPTAEGQLRAEATMSIYVHYGHDIKSSDVPTAQCAFL